MGSFHGGPEPCPLGCLHPCPIYKDFWERGRGESDCQPQCSPLSAKCSQGSLLALPPVQDSARPTGPRTKHTIFSHCTWWSCCAPASNTSSWFSHFQGTSCGKIAPKCWSLEPGIIRVCFLEERWDSA